MVIKLSGKIRFKKSGTDGTMAANLTKGQTALVAKFNLFFDELGKHFVNRDMELEQVKYALLTRDHVLWKGLPGTAKSMLARSVFRNIIGAKVFEEQLSKFMGEEYIFGPVNIKKIREDGEIIHNTANTLVDADFAFVDEVFDATGPLLRSMLEILNERTFTRNTQRIDCPLHTAIMSSNYSREDEETAAFLDRLMFKSDVQPIADTKGRLAMYQTFLSDNANHGFVKLDKEVCLTLDEVKQLSSLVNSSAIKIAKPILEVYDDVLREFHRQSKVYISDRTSAKVLRVLKACSILHGRMEVEVDDVPAAKLAICVSNDDQKTDLFDTVINKLITEQKEAGEDLRKLEDIKSRFSDSMKSKKSNDPTHDAVEKLRDIRRLKKELEALLAQCKIEVSRNKGIKINADIDAALENLRQKAVEDIPGIGDTDHIKNITHLKELPKGTSEEDVEDAEEAKF